MRENHSGGACRASRHAPVRLAIVAAMALLAAPGCSSSGNPTYSSNDVGQVIESSRGRVISSRPVDISASGQGGIGAATGGIVGGIAGSTIGAGKGQSLAVAGGILAGVILGQLLEKELRSGQGTEYTVEMDDGRVVTIVQEGKSGEAPIPNGREVSVQYGVDQTRITPLDPATAGAYPPSSYPPADPATSQASAPYPGSAPPPYPSESSGQSTASASTPPSSSPSSSGTPVRPGDSEWRNPDLDSDQATVASGTGGDYNPDPTAPPIFVPGPTNAN